MLRSGVWEGDRWVGASHTPLQKQQTGSGRDLALGHQTGHSPVCRASGPETPCPAPTVSVAVTKQHPGKQPVSYVLTVSKSQWEKKKVLNSLIQECKLLEFFFLKEKLLLAHCL